MTEIPGAIQELMARQQWVAWSKNKVPMAPSGGPAKTTDADTWGTFEDARVRQAQSGLPGVGYVFSPDDPYVGIDLDHARNAETGRLEPWAEKIVRALDSYTEVSPSGEGLHIFVRGELERAARRTIDNGNGRVELYDRGRYFTVTGRHLAGTPTEILPRQEPLDILHVWAREKDKPSVNVPHTHVTYETTDPMMWVPEALTFVDAHDHDVWLAVGMALRNEIGDSAWHTFNDWSKTAQNYGGEAETWKRWRSFPDDGSGRRHLGTIVWFAEQHGFEMPEECLGVVRYEIPPDFIGGWDEWLEAQELLQNQTKDLQIRLIDYSEAYLDETPPEPDIVSPGVLGAGDMMLIAGPPKSMKSFLMLDMVRSWCLGEEWHGMRPARPLTAAIVQFEIKADNMRRRAKMAKLSVEDLRQLKRRLAYTDRCAPVLTPAFMDALAESIKASLDEPADLVVIDPMANLYTGDNENDNTQMLEFLRMVRVLRNKINPDACLVLVHHASKRSQTEREAEPFNALRGASSLRGSYDTGLYVEKQSEQSVKVWLELRNGPPLPTLTLTLEEGVFKTHSEHVRAAVIEKVLNDALVGVAMYSSTFVSTYADDLGVGERILGAIVSQMITEGDLVRWVPEEGHELEMSARAKGYLGVPGMVFRGLPITSISEI